MNESEPIVIPEDPIGVILDSLDERQEQRLWAIELAQDRFDNARTVDESMVALNALFDMIEIWQSFLEQFPEVFPREKATSE